MAEVQLASLPIFAQLDAAELAVLKPHLARRVFAAGEFVFREGDPGNDLYVITLGTASVRRVDGARSTRLATFGPKHGVRRDGAAGRPPALGQRAGRRHARLLRDATRGLRRDGDAPPRRSR
jgi:CRP-like cAMP-binding protein